MSSGRKTAPAGRTGARQAVERLADDRLAHLVRYVARGLTRSLQIRLAEQDVQFGHWVFLRILWDGDGLTQKALSERAGLMESTTHTALAKLESLGYVTRRNPPDNRRKLLVFLTPRGRKLRDLLEPMAEEVNAVSVEGLSESEIAVLRRSLLAMAENLDADEESASADGRGVPATRALGS